MIVKVEIFSGFLGAGKTQLIKKLIEEGYYKDRIAIIENEFGEVSIDGEILSRTNTLVKEINAGCICCQVTGDFKESIKDVVENCNVDRLIVEPTGVAKLSDLKNTFEEKDLKEIAQIEKIITVVDSEKFNIYLKNFKNFFVNQIKNANLIVLSRTQNIEENQLKKVEAEIRKINNNAQIVSTPWNKIKAKELIPIKLQYKNLKESNEKTEEKNEDKSFKTMRKLSFRSKAVVKKEKSLEEMFETFALKIEKKLSKEELISKFNFMKDNEEFGKIVRAKGIVNTKNGTEQFNYTLTEIEMEEVKYKGEAVISFIGTNLNKDKISKFFL